MLYLLLETLPYSTAYTMYSSSFRGRYRNRFGYKYGFRKRGSYRTLSGVTRSQIPTKITRQEVAKIAKKISTRTEELKLYDNSYASSATNGAWYVTNLFSGWTQNVSSSGHIGRKICLKGLRFKVRFATSAGYSGSNIRFMVFRTSQQLTASTSAAVPQGEIFRLNPSSFDPTLLPDPESVDVLADRSGVINPQTTSGGDVAFWEIDVPHSKMLSVLGESNSYFKETNYYVYFAMNRDDGAITTSGFISFSLQLQYTDA